MHSFFTPPRIATRIVLGLLAGGLLLRTDVDGAELDRYGGWQDVPGEATGWFHIEPLGRRQLLVTPDGHGFVALGVNHLHAIAAPGDSEQDWFHTRFSGDWQSVRTHVRDQFKAWGFNTVDSGGEPFRRLLPYFTSRTFAKTSKYFAKPGTANAYDFPDVFDPRVVARLKLNAREMCRHHRDSKTLIAYLWTDTPTWDLDKTRRFRQTDWVSELRRLPSDSAGKRRYVQFLQQRYGDDMRRFRQTYGFKAETFDQLATMSFQHADLSHDAIRRDDQEFLGEIARAYYGAIGQAIREHDPHHLVFGERYLLGDAPPQVIKAATPYVDAIAVQPGDGYLPIYTPGDVFPRQEIERLHRLTGKPIFICDHQVSFTTNEYPTATWPYHQRASEADAAKATEQFIKAAFAEPYVIGYMRCQYIDRYSARRDAMKLGLIRADGTPHEKLVAATTLANASVKQAVHAEVVNARKTSLGNE